MLGLAVMLSGPDEDRFGFSWWLGRAGCIEVTDITQADLVVFTGGSDVSPGLYGESAIKDTFPDKARDDQDMALYDECFNNRVPMLGICRGSQFLWTRLGGKLYQDIDNHNSGYHQMEFIPGKEVYTVSSVHHQAIVPASFNGLVLLGKSNESSRRETEKSIVFQQGVDFEMWAIESKGIIGIQGHPEYKGYPNYSRLCAEVIERYISNSDKIGWENGVMRVKETV